MHPRAAVRQFQDIAIESSFEDFRRHAHAIEPRQGVKIFLGIVGENAVTGEGDLAAAFLFVIVDQSETVQRNAALDSTGRLSTLRIPRRRMHCLLAFPLARDLFELAMSIAGRWHFHAGTITGAHHGQKPNRLLAHLRLRCGERSAHSAAASFRRLAHCR